jgi:hypothetical protein
MNRAQSLRIAGLAGILGVAVLRAMVLIEPRVWFDVDPAVDAMALLAIGQAFSHALDLVLLLASALALFGEVRAGRGIRTGLVLLALLPTPVIVWHGLDGESGNMFRAGTWLSAMLAFVALGHLVRERRMRVVAVSVLSGLMIALAGRGFVQVFVEHPATVAMYRETRDAFLANRGWTADSSAALTYERRLLQPEATGWFGLSNPFSTLMGAGAIALGALAIFARRALQSGSTLLLAIGCAACATLLAINFGKGAIGATAIAGIVLAYALRRHQPPRASLALLLCAAVLVAVCVRGVVGTRIGELSLLLRSFYLEAGWNMLSHGSNAMLGVGADGVQELFSSAKPAICPEDVQSLHSMFADWIVALGVSAVAWVALICAGFWRPLASDGLRGAVIDEHSDADTNMDPRRMAFSIALGAGVLSMLIQMTVESPTVDVSWFILRAIGVVAFTAFAAVAAEACEAIGVRTLAAIAFAMAVLVLIHAQIELVAWSPGSCVIALCLVATGSAFGYGRETPSARVYNSFARALGLLAALQLAFSCVQSFAREDRVAQAAALLTPLARANDAANNESNNESNSAALHMQAADILAQDDWISARWVGEAAVRQYAAAALITSASTTSGEGNAALNRAWSLADERSRRGLLSPLLVADIAMLRMRLERKGERSELEIRACLDVVERAARTHPWNARRAIDLGMAHEMAHEMTLDKMPLELVGDRSVAVAAYEHALEINAKLSLDPLAQLSTREVDFVRSAIKRLESARMKE